MIEASGTLTISFADANPEAINKLFPKKETTDNLLKNDYSVKDLFEMGQCSYELSLSDYMFIVDAQPKDCLMFFLCQAEGLSASRIIEYDFNADEPCVTIVMPGYNFALTIVCSSMDLVQKKAIIYTNVSDLPDDIKSVLLADVMQEAKGR